MRGPEKMNILKRAAIWLLTKQEKKTMKIGITLLKNSQPADGVSQNQVQITLMDNAGAPVPGATVNLSVTNGTVQGSGVTDSTGVITVPVTSSTAGASTITATALDGAQASDSTLYFVAVQPVTNLVDKSAVVDTQPSALETLKASFAAKLQFIEDGIAALGSEAEEELVALAEKYL